MRRLLLIAAAAFLGWAWLEAYVERQDGQHGEWDFAGRGLA